MQASGHTLKRCQLIHEQQHRLLFTYSIEVASCYTMLVHMCLMHLYTCSCAPARMHTLMDTCQVWKRMGAVWEHVDTIGAMHLGPLLLRKAVFMWRSLYCRPERSIFIR